MSAHFAMLVPAPSAVPAGQGDGPEPESEALAARVAAGPGLWDDKDWLAELRRDGLIGELLACRGDRAGGGRGRPRAPAGAGADRGDDHCCASSRAPFSPVRGMTWSWPGRSRCPGRGSGRAPVSPTGPALSQGRARLGEQADAAGLRAATPRGTTSRWRRAGPRSAWSWSSSTAPPWTCSTARSWRRSSASPRAAGIPKLRLVALLQAGTMRWKAAAVGGYHDGENALADQLEGALRPGQLSLADRGFFSMDRWIRFSAAGAHLLWRVKNAARSVPFRQLRTLKDGSELVLLRESGSMLGKRRRDAGDRGPAQAAGHRRPPGLLHHPDPHPPRQGQDRGDPRADHAAGPGCLPGSGDRGPLRSSLAGGNRFSCT